MPGRAIPCWKALARYNEGSRIGASIKQELANNVQGEHGILAEAMVGEPKDAEENGKKQEAKYLERLAAKGVNGEDGGPISWYRPSTSKDYHAHGLVVEFVIY